jgi:Bacterial SH3 domain
MERVRQKMEDVIQKQKRLQEQSQAKTQSSSARDKSHYILALGGVAAGLTIAVIVWLAKSIVTTDHVNMSAADRADAIHTGLIKKSSDNIARLNERVELLTESVSSLEARLRRVLVLTDSITGIDKKDASSSRQAIPEAADAGSAFAIQDPNASSASHTIPEAGKAFVPTHAVNARINLRPSPSSNTTPIAVLNAGSEIEYIRETDGWYYVNTQSHGKGWCSSEYLSPLSPAQQKATAN